MPGYVPAPEPNAYPVITWDRLDDAGLKQLHTAILKEMRKVEGRVFTAGVRNSPNDFTHMRLIVTMRDDDETLSIALQGLTTDPERDVEEYISVNVPPLVFFLTLGVLYGRFAERRYRR
jgi:hypothetical protein